MTDDVFLRHLDEVHGIAGIPEYYAEDEHAYDHEAAGPLLHHDHEGDVDARTVLR